MRALVCREYGPPGSLSLEEVDEPTPGPEQIVIDVVAAGVNFPDVLVIAGKYQDRSTLPFVPGNEVAGVVSAVGEGVTTLALGQKVFATVSGGAFAGKCVADESSAFPLPRELSFDQGAGLPITYFTSWHALRQCADLQAGETVLVLGAAGGVGTTAVESAKAMGARVIAAASTAAKLEFAKEAGADFQVNYATEPLNQRVKELTGGAGVDVVYDPVGGDQAVLALRATAWHGRYLVVGFASGHIPQFPANLALLKEARITGVWWGPWAMRNPALQRRNVEELLAEVRGGRIRPRITASYPVDDFRSAFADIVERRVRGKVVLRFREPGTGSA